MVLLSSYHHMNASYVNYSLLSIHRHRTRRVIRHRAVLRLLLALLLLLPFLPLLVVVVAFAFFVLFLVGVARLFTR